LHLVELAARFGATATRARRDRSLLSHALAGDVPAREQALAAEEDGERLKDKTYWAPLRRELERMPWGGG
jgi:hypothetical protein